MTTLLLHAVAAGLLAVPQVTNPCDLLTQAEAEAIMGQPIAAPTVGGSGECHYATKDGMTEIIVYPMQLGFNITADDRKQAVAVAAKTLPRIK